MEYLTDLNNDQRRAVLHTEGALLIFAGAGTGKTKTLTTRIAHILQQNICSPEQVLCMTFTNKAAKEMRSRLARAVGDNATRVHMGTFHSICLKILRTHTNHTYLTENFSIATESEQRRIAKDILSKLNVGVDDKGVKKYLSAVSWKKNNEKTKFALYRWEAFFEAYQEDLSIKDLVDFDDLILLTVQLLNNHKPVRDFYRKQFKYILVDEYQDTNKIQCTLLQLLLNPEHNNICCVGDDDQSIYEWRGAEIENILEFKKYFPSPETIILQTNYRSRPKILRAALDIVERVGARCCKDSTTHSQVQNGINIFDFSSDRDEAVFIAHEIKRLQQKDATLLYKDFAIITRINALRAPIIEYLSSKGVPCSSKEGKDFYLKASVKDILAYLSLINNPNDMNSFRRAINTPRRGFGAKSLQVLLGSFQGSLIDAVNKSEKDLKPKAYQTLYIFTQTILQLNSLLSSIPLTDIILRVKEIMGQEEDSELFEKILMDLDGCNVLGDFLDYIAIKQLHDNKKDEDEVNVMTVHAAKGLEFRVVFFIGFDEGILPMDSGQLDESMRLAYVGMTRAKEQLFIHSTRARCIYGEYKNFTPSRFLSMISPELYTRYTVLVSYGLENDYKISLKKA